MPSRSLLKYHSVVDYCCWWHFWRRTVIHSFLKETCHLFFCNLSLTMHHKSIYSAARTCWDNILLCLTRLPLIQKYQLKTDFRTKHQAKSKRKQLTVDRFSETKMELKNKDSHCLTDFELFPYLLILNKKGMTKTSVFTVEVCTVSGWLSGPASRRRLCHTSCVKETRNMISHYQPEILLLSGSKTQRKTVRTELI